MNGWRYGWKGCMLQERLIEVGWRDALEGWMEKVVDGYESLKTRAQKLLDETVGCMEDCLDGWWVKGWMRKMRDGWIKSFVDIVMEWYVEGWIEE